nr:MAG TPA: hypothetical protein [Caudoviricetes sp.]
MINTDAIAIAPPLIAAITLFRSAGDIAIQSVLALFALVVPVDAKCADSTKNTNDDSPVIQGENATHRSQSSEAVTEPFSDFVHTVHALPLH